MPKVNCDTGECLKNKNGICTDKEIRVIIPYGELEVVCDYNCEK